MFARSATHTSCSVGEMLGSVPTHAGEGALDCPDDAMQIRRFGTASLPELPRSARRGAQFLRIGDRVAFQDAVGPGAVDPLAPQRR